MKIWTAEVHNGKGEGEARGKEVRRRKVRERESPLGE